MVRSLLAIIRQVVRFCSCGSSPTRRIVTPAPCRGSSNCYDADARLSLTLRAVVTGLKIEGVMAGDGPVAEQCRRSGTAGDRNSSACACGSALYYSVVFTFATD
jgi:hypothetical protein